MKSEEQIERRMLEGRSPVMVRVSDREFEHQVIEKLGVLEAKMDMLVGDRQPGRMKLAEERLRSLEHSEVRRSVYDRLINAAIAVAISVGIALHNHFGLK